MYFSLFRILFIDFVVFIKILYYLIWYFVDLNKNEFVILMLSIYNILFILDIKCIRLNRSFFYIIN